MRAGEFFQPVCAYMYMYICTYSSFLVALFTGSAFDRLALLGTLSNV